MEAMRWSHSAETCSPGPPQTVTHTLTGPYEHQLCALLQKKDARGERARALRRKSLRLIVTLELPDIQLQFVDIGVGRDARPSRASV